MNLGEKSAMNQYKTDEDQVRTHQAGDSVIPAGGTTWYKSTEYLCLYSS